MVMVAGCTSAPVGREPTSVSPSPVGPAALPPLPAEAVGCGLPRENADDLRAADAPTAWRPVWVDGDRGSMALLAAAADGSLWTTYSTEKEENGVLTSAGGGVRRWDGSGWETSQVPRARPQYPQSEAAIAAVSADQAWVFGAADGASSKDTTGFVGTFDDGRWRADLLDKPAADSIGWAFTAVRAVGGGEVWSVNGPAGLLWTGQEWRYHPLPSSAGALGSGDGQVWAVSGEHSPPAAMRWEPAGWRLITTPPVVEPPGDIMLPRTVLADVVVIGRDDVWVVGGISWLVDGEYDENNEPLEKGHTLALHWNGKAWACHWGPMSSTGEPDGRPMTRFSQAEPDGRGGLWVIGHPDLLWHLRDGRWTRHRIPAPAGSEARVHSLAWRPGTHEVYAVGSVISKGENNSEISHAALWRTGAPSSPE